MNRLLPDWRQAARGSCLVGHAAVGAGGRPDGRCAGTGACNMEHAVSFSPCCGVGVHQQSHRRVLGAR